MKKNMPYLGTVAGRDAIRSLEEILDRTPSNKKCDEAMLELDRLDASRFQTGAGQ